MALVLDSFRLMFAKIRLCLHELARRGRRPRPSPTAVLLVVAVLFVVTCHKRQRVTQAENELDTNSEFVPSVIRL